MTVVRMARVSEIERGPGYPTIEVTETRFNLLRAHLRRIADALPNVPRIVMVVRKYGLKRGENGVQKAKDLLVRIAQLMLRSTYVEGVVISVNPKVGQDYETVECLREALTSMAPRERKLLKYLCIAHIVQPEGSKNSWSGGLGGPAAMLKKTIVSKHHWATTWLWNVSAEVVDHTIVEQVDNCLIENELVVSRRDSPTWMHDAFLIERTPWQTLKDFRALLENPPADWMAQDVQDCLVRIIPYCRNTCGLITLRDVEEVGLWSSECNGLGGMEDWHWMIHSFEGLNDEVDLIDAWQPEWIVHVIDPRITAMVDEGERAKQRTKLGDELRALTAHCQNWIAAGRPSVIAEQFQEFVHTTA